MKSFCLFVCLFLFSSVNFAAANSVVENRHSVAKKRPNVIVILSDDQGWGDLSVNGNKDLKTPHIDSIARDGAAFNNFYVSAVCSPTRAEILTGRYNFRSGVRGTSRGIERIDLDELTIADTFKSAGYQTGTFGKWHNGNQYPYHPNGRGFHEFFGFTSGHSENYFSNAMVERNGVIVGGKGYCTDDFTTQAMKFMESNHTNEKPFFAYLTYNTPHSPMQVPDKYWDNIKDKKLQMKHLFAASKKGGQAKNTDFVKAALAMCENIDWNVGRVLKKLDQLKIADNTIVLYFSDNGPNSLRWNGGMKGKKGSVDEGGVRSPLVMRWPGKIKAGLKIQEVTGAVDLLPTLASMAGIPVISKKTLDGKNFDGLVTGKKIPFDKNRLYFNVYGKRVSVRTQKFRLDERGKLFDIENDRGQKIDVSKKHPKITRELQKKMAEMKAQIKKERPAVDTRPFIISHPDYPHVRLPPGDGKGHGNIKQSNRYTNSSYFKNWIHLNDKITFNAEAMTTAEYDVEILYTCPKDSIGTIFEISFGKHKVQGKITKAHNPPETGMKHDRFPRVESYPKDFISMKVGRLKIEKGKGILTLKAITKPGKEVMDFRMMIFKKVEKK